MSDADPAQVVRLKHPLQSFTVLDSRRKEQ
jgi:hypothetical protein